MKWDFVTDRDIPSLLQLTVDTYKESEWSDTEWDIKKIERMLYRAINEPHQFFIKAEQGGQPSAESQGLVSMEETTMTEMVGPEGMMMEGAMMEGAI